MSDETEEDVVNLQSRGEVDWLAAGREEQGRPADEERDSETELRVLRLGDGGDMTQIATYEDDEFRGHEGLS
jgi:hypothetical protein